MGVRYDKASFRWLYWSFASDFVREALGRYSAGLTDTKVK
jgi:hypothetical protein